MTSAQRRLLVRGCYTLAAVSLAVAVGIIPVTVAYVTAIPSWAGARSGIS